MPEGEEREERVHLIRKDQFTLIDELMLPLTGSGGF